MVLPNSRAAAVVANLNKYNTGEPCRNGHYADRYTQSGTCQACIAAAVPHSLDKYVGASLQLETIKIRCMTSDYKRVLELAVALTAIRTPEAKVKHIAPAQKGTKGAAGTALYTFHLHPEDGAAVLAHAKQLLAAHSANGAVERQRIFGHLFTLAAQPETPEPEFRP